MPRQYHRDQSLDVAVDLESIDQAAHGLPLADLDNVRDIGGGVFIITADAWEQKSEALWMPLREGDLVPVRNFKVTKNLSERVDRQWARPFWLVSASQHTKSGLLQDFVTEGSLQTRKGRLNEWFHVDDIRLLDTPINGLAHDKSNITIDAFQTAADWEPEEENAVNYTSSLMLSYFTPSHPPSRILWGIKFQFSWP